METSFFLSFFLYPEDERLPRRFVLTVSNASSGVTVVLV